MRMKTAEGLFLTVKYVVMFLLYHIFLRIHVHVVHVQVLHVPRYILFIFVLFLAQWRTAHIYQRWKSSQNLESLQYKPSKVLKRKLVEKRPTNIIPTPHQTRLTPSRWQNTKIR